MGTGSLIVAIIFVASVNAAPSANPFILNGTAVSIFDYPWVISFRYQANHNCGGVLISDSWALTAGHCYGAAIQYGVTTLSRNENLKATLLMVHPDFNNVTLENDIALLKLETPVEFANNVQPVKMPPRDVEIGAPSWELSANVVGYGAVEPTFPYPIEYLQAAELKIVRNNECQPLIEGQLFNTQLCAGVPGGYKGYCAHDSGGPLTLEDGTLVGIVSNGIKSCSNSPRPNIFTKVSKYIDWIEEKTGLSFE